MSDNLTLFENQTKQTKPLSEFDMYRLYCSMAGRDFDINNMPVEMRVFTDKGVHSFSAGDSISRFKEG